jgi:hypothetical protein
MLRKSKWDRPSGDNVPSALNPNIDLIANINELERKNRQLTEQNLKLQTKSFSVNNFLSSDKDISYYTGFPNVKIFMSVYVTCQKSHPVLWIFKEMPHEYRVDQYTPGFQNCIYSSNAHIK